MLHHGRLCCAACAAPLPAGSGRVIGICEGCLSARAHMSAAGKHRMYNCRLHLHPGGALMCSCLSWAISISAICINSWPYVCKDFIAAHSFGGKQKDLVFAFCCCCCALVTFQDGYSSKRCTLFNDMPYIARISFLCKKPKGCAHILGTLHT